MNSTLKLARRAALIDPDAPAVSVIAIELETVPPAPKFAAFRSLERVTVMLLPSRVQPDAPRESTTLPTLICAAAFATAKHVISAATAICLRSRRSEERRVG